MNGLDFIIKIAKNISEISDEDAARLYNELDAKYGKMVTTPGAEGYVDNWKTKVVSFFRLPETRLAMCCTHLIIIKTIKDWYNGKFDDDDDTK